MKKKVSKKKKKVKQKIDVVLESLLNLEQRTKELIKRVEELERLTFALYYKNKDDNKQYWWPNTNPPYKYDGVMWNHSKPIVGYDSCTGEPITMDSWKNNKNKDSY